MSIEFVYLLKGVVVMLVVLLTITLFVFFIVDILRYFFMKEVASWMQFMAYVYKQICVAYKQVYYAVHKQVYDVILMFSILCLSFCRSTDYDLEMLAIRIQHLQEKALTK